MNLKLNPKETALVLIDLQGGIVSRELAPHTAQDVIARCAKLAAALREAGGVVVYVHLLLNEISQSPADKPRPRPPAPLPASASG